MVKGICRQVILVHSPDPKLFEQAIFILREDAQGVTDEELLKEADRVLKSHRSERKSPRLMLYGPVWACGGAMLTGILWILTALF